MTSPKIQIVSGFASLLSDFANNGLVVYGINTEGKSFTQTIKTDTLKLEIPVGTWSFYAVAWKLETPGADTALSGKSYCGKLENINLNADEASLEIFINNAECANSVFSSFAKLDSTGTAQLPNLKLISCQDLNGISSFNDDNICSPANNNEGYATHYRVKIYDSLNFDETTKPERILGLQSACFSTSTASTSLNVPTNFPGKDAVIAIYYSPEACNESYGIDEIPLKMDPSANHLAFGSLATGAASQGTIKYFVNTGLNLLHYARNFTIDSSTPGIIGLTWSSAGTATTGYKIAYLPGQLAPASCSEGTVIDVGNTQAHTLSGLNSDNNYSFRICSYDSSGKTNLGFASSATAVVASSPLIDYTAATGTSGSVGVAMSVAPTTLNANGSPITNCTIAPALPAWASIDSASCVISGTPSATMVAQTYTVTVSNSIGSGSGTVTLSVIDTTAPIVQDVYATETDGIAPKPNAYYKSGTQIGIVIKFSENIVVTGTPQITLNSSAAPVDCTGHGSLPDSLICIYTVAAGDNSPNLDYTSTTALAFNTGTIKDVDGNNANLTLPTIAGLGSISNDQAIIIDAINPTVTEVYAVGPDGMTIKPDGVYSAGAVINIVVKISEAITLAGTPQLTLNSSPTAISCSAHPSFNNALLCNYTVAAGDSSADLDYASSAALVLNGATINDFATNPAVIVLAQPGAINSISDDQNIVIDTLAPAVTQVYATHADGVTPKPNGNYTIGEVISIIVEFNKNIFVSGTPSISLNLGISATCVAHPSLMTSLKCDYTVQAGHMTALLEYASMSALILNGGTIQDSAFNNANLILPTPGALNSISDNQSIAIDTVAPVVNHVYATYSDGTTIKPDGSYTIGEVISIIVEFDKSLVVSGVPSIDLNVGTSATCIAHPGIMTSLKCDYTVQAGHMTAFLDYANTTALALNGGTITDIANNNANLTLAMPGAINSISDDQTIVIDTTVPTVADVYATEADGVTTKPDASYTAGEVIGVVVRFSKDIYVTGTPQITLNSTASAVDCAAHGSLTDALLCSYTVAAGHSSTDLDYANTTALALNGGTIRDAASNDANLILPTPGTLNSISDNQNLVIDTIAPTVTEVYATESSGMSLLADRIYLPGETIGIVILFSENITTFGTPQIILNSSAASVNCAAHSTLNNALLCVYTITSIDNAIKLDYSSTSSIILNGGMISDAASNNALLILATPGALNSISDDQNLRINTPYPPTSLTLVDPISSPHHSDNITIHITGVESGDIIQIFSDSFCSGSTIASQVASGTDININSSAIQIGFHSFYASATNVNGFTSECSTAFLTYERVPCPPGYAEIPFDNSVGTYSNFCAMKFEAKNELGLPVSAPLGTPWTGIDSSTAKNACTSIGINYDLISNPEWMTIARNIEIIPTNWDSNAVGIGALFRGHSDSTPAGPLEVLNDTDPYDGTGNSSAQTSGAGKEQFRIQYLSNGEFIWDFTGNVAEWVDWFVSPSYKAYVSSDNSPVALFREFADLDTNLSPEMIHSTWQASEINFTSTHNIGQYFAGLSGTGGAAVRGGSWEGNQAAGIYALNLQYANTYTNASIGFRCVYRPPP